MMSLTGSLWKEIKNFSSVLIFAIQCSLSTAITCWVIDCKVAVQDDIHGTRVLRVDSATRMITASYAVVEWRAHAGWARGGWWVSRRAGPRILAPSRQSPPLLHSPARQRFDRRRDLFHLRFLLPLNFYLNLGKFEGTSSTSFSRVPVRAVVL